MWQNENFEIVSFPKDNVTENQILNPKFSFEQMAYYQG